MRKYKSLWLVLVFSLFTNICMVFVINYTVGSKIASNYQPYNLSHSHAHLVNHDNHHSNFDEILDFNDYENLIVIARIPSSAIVGLLDLPMKYYHQSSKVIAPNIYRYFSQEDYISKKNVGVVVNHCEMFDIEAVKSSKEFFGLDEVLNCFDADKWELESINLLQNIYSIDFQKVSSVFVDSVDHDEIDRAVKVFHDAGFTVTEKKDNVSITLSFLESLFGRKTQQFTALLGLSIYGLYVFIMMLFAHKYSKTIRVHRIVGAQNSDILKFVVIQTMILSLCIGAVTSFVMVYFSYMGINSLTWLNFIKAQFFMFITNLLISLSATYINFEKSKFLSEESRYD